MERQLCSLTSTSYCGFSDTVLRHFRVTLLLPSSKMADKTTSASSFDRKFGLFAPGFQLGNAFLDVYLQG